MMISSKVSKFVGGAAEGDHEVQWPCRQARKRRWGWGKEGTFRKGEE
jgi:hypothetical protein